MNISYSLPNVATSKRKDILRSVGGIAGNGKLFSTQDERNSSQHIPSDDSSGIFAILGPSGAGKTTLLDILSGQPMPGEIDGNLYINGQPVSFHSMRQIAGYVPQDVVLPGTSTVLEYLMFHAALRLPQCVDSCERRHLVLGIIEELGLSRVQDNLIGNDFVRGLSGGEKRRVSIASELITQPAVLMLDEPTTGLDSTNAAKVVDILSGLVDDGVTVLLSIHQPRSDVFQMLRRLLILSSEGQTVFSGPAHLAASHFSSIGYDVEGKSMHMHVADIILDLVIRSPQDEVESMVKAFTTSDVAQQEVDEAFNQLETSLNESDADRVDSLEVNDSIKMLKFKASFHLQVHCLLGRHCRNIRRNPFVTIFHVLGCLAMALFIGTVFYHTDVDSGGIQVRF